MQVVGERLDDDALGRSQRVEFDEVLLIDEAAGRRKAGHDQKIVADLRIADAMQLMRLVERDGDAGARRTDQVAGDIEGVGRIGDGVADGHAPTRPVG